MGSKEWTSGPKKRSSITRRAVNSVSMPIRSVTMSLSIILVIAIGGAVLLFAAIGVVIVLYIKRRNRYKSRVRTEVSEHRLILADPRNTMRSIRTPEIIFPRRISRGLSFNQWTSLDGRTAACDWEDVQLSDHPPPMATAKRLSFHRGLVRVRESWPLATNIPLKMLPSQTSMVLSPVAPPGYLIQEPKRQSTKLSRRPDSTESKGDSKVPKSSDGLPSRDLFPAPLMIYKNTQRRSTSDAQIPPIRRSTSQRMKSTHQKTLTRALTTIGRISGPVPAERLPTPPMKNAVENREQLINKEFAQSIEDHSVSQMSFDVVGRSLTDQGTKSPVPSVASIDSLCEASTLEVVLPVALSSPSKSSLPGEKLYKERTFDDATMTQSSIREDYPDSLLVIAKPRDQSLSPAPPPNSRTGDPFLSSVRTSKFVVSSTQVHGSRPMYIRKSTFGHQESPSRPEDYISPLRDVSGNAQSSSQTTNTPDDTEHNPFRWSPQDALKTRVNLNPLSGRTSPNRKGHRRSNVVRMSNLPVISPRISTVDIVKEEPEEDSPGRSIRFSLPPAMAIRIFEPEKSPSPSSSTASRRRSMRPPSSATFSPDLAIVEGLPTTPNSSPISKLGSQGSLSVYSPTLSVCNYYAENGGSEDEFFNSKKASSAILKARRHGRNYSEELSTLPTNQLQQDHDLALASSPAIPEPNIPTMTVLTPPPSRPLPTIASTMTTCHSSSPALLGGQSQLYGPRDIPSRASTLSPPRDSLVSSISMLRRMNCQMSQCSSQSTIIEESPRPQPQPPISLNFNVEEAKAEERGRNRGSKNYLAIGRQSQHYNRISRAERRDSHRVYKDRRKRQIQDFERDDKELTPVPETSPTTPWNGLGIIGLQFPTLTREGAATYTPTRDSRITDITIEEDIPDARTINLNDDNKENLDNSRWSDAMTKPIKNVVRRESQMEHPNPQTPPKWSMSGLGLAGQRLVGKDKEGIPISGDPERPISIGLYDQEGFLKSSPEIKLAKDRANEMRKTETKSRRLSGEWHCIM